MKFGLYSVSQDQFVLFCNDLHTISVVSKLLSSKSLLAICVFDSDFVPTIDSGIGYKLISSGIISAASQIPGATLIPASAVVQTEVSASVLDLVNFAKLLHKIVQIIDAVDLRINQDLLFFKTILNEKISAPDDLSGLATSIKNQIYKVLYMSDSCEEIHQGIAAIFTQTTTQPTFLNKYKTNFDKAINLNEFTIFDVFC